MRGNTHLLVGAAVGAVVAAASHESVVPLVAAGLFGGLLPDVDHPRSVISRFLWPLWIIAPGVSHGQYRNGRRWLWWHLEWHRGRVHSISVGAALAAILLVTWWPLGFAFLAGWLSHLAIDMPQPSRVPYLLWPILRRPIKIPKGVPAFAEEGRIDTFVLEPLVMLASGGALAVMGLPELVGGFAALAVGR